MVGRDQGSLACLKALLHLNETLGGVCFDSVYFFKVISNLLTDRVDSADFCFSSFAYWWDFQQQLHQLGFKNMGSPTIGLL